MGSRELPTLEKGRRTEIKNKKAPDLTEGGNFNDIAHPPIIRVFTVGNPMSLPFKFCYRPETGTASIREKMEGRNNKRKGILLPAVVFQCEGSPWWGSNTFVRLYSIRIDLGLIPSYHIRYFHHNYLDRLAIIMILSDQTNKQPAPISIREILRTLLFSLFYPPLIPPALLPSPPTTLKTSTLILTSVTTTLFLISIPPDTRSAPYLPRTLHFNRYYFFFSQGKHSKQWHPVNKVWQGQVHLHSPYL